MTEKTIFESFNARYLMPQDVAKTFVPSQHYKDLVERNHSVLIGPRGSGKTTLLKMLQPAALSAWVHDEADSYRSKIDYTGVFIGTDNSWRNKLDAMGSLLDSEIFKRISISTFTTHVLKSLIVAMRQRCSSTDTSKNKGFKSVLLTPTQEAELSESLASAWYLDIGIPTLRSVQNSLMLRLKRIKEDASTLSLKRSVKARNDSLLSKNYLHLEYLTSSLVGIDMFNDLVEEPGGQWALMFDELELAPENLQKNLMTSLRSVDDRIIFKLAISPHMSTSGSLDTIYSPSPRNDFKQISLWYAHKEDGVEFCTQLWRGMLSEKKIDYIDPKEALGLSYFEFDKVQLKGKKTAYRNDSDRGKQIKDLASVDESFSRFLEEHDIDINKLEGVKKIKRESILRKIGPTVPFRSFYLRSKGSENRQPVLRTRKSYSIYAGAASLFAISEGNPRWFIGMINEIINKWEDRRKKIPANIQATEIKSAAEKYSSMLKLIPIPLPPSFNGPRGVLPLVKLIANFFYHEAVTSDFKLDPYGSFIVDSVVNDKIINMLEQALNMGAIVYVPGSDGQLILSSLKGKRFRLSYLLSSQYKLPVRLGKAINLNTILSKEDKRQKKLDI